MVENNYSKAKFKPFDKITNEVSWKYVSKRPIGQQWSYNDGFCTNRRGEGFRLPRNIKNESINQLVDALNKRDTIIHNLKQKLKED